MNGTCLTQLGRESAHVLPPVLNPGGRPSDIENQRESGRQGGLEEPVFQAPRLEGVWGMQRRFRSPRMERYNQGAGKNSRNQCFNEPVSRLV